MSNSTIGMTNFSSLSNDDICILKLVGPKITLPRVITLPYFPLHVYEGKNIKRLID